MAGGARRSVSLQKYRMQKVKSASKVISTLSKKCKSYKKLEFTGILSRLYRFSVLGAAPSATRDARNAICAPLSCRKPGCLTTALAMQDLSSKDPAGTVPMENVVDFLAGHRASDHALITAQYWPKVVDKLVPNGRWSKVLGHLAVPLPHWWISDGNFQR